MRMRFMEWERFGDLVENLIPHGWARIRAQERQLDRLGVPAPSSRRERLDPRRARVVRRALEMSRLHLLPDESLRSPEVVVDIGANVGRWSAALLALREPRRLIAVEPNPALRDELRATIGGHGCVEIHPVALGREPGRLALQVTAHADNASFRRPVPGQDEIYGFGWDVVDSADVDVVRLDDLVADEPTVDIVKLDVQGFEEEVLAGAEATLARVRNLLVEIVFRPHYEDELLFPELHRLLTDAGMVLSGIGPPWTRDGVAYWSDALYCRADVVGARS